MALAPEDARALLERFEAAPLRNLFAQAQARQVLEDVGATREDFPRFDPDLDGRVTFAAYGVLEAGCSLIERGAGEEGRLALPRAALLLQSIHGPRASSSRESAFQLLVSGMAFYAGGQYSRAFVVLKDVEPLTPAAGILRAFLRKDTASLMAALNEVLLRDVPEVQEQRDLDEWAVTIAVARAVGGSFEFSMTGERALLGLGAEQLAAAEVVARVGEHPAWWWVVRLLRLMLEDLGEASPWTVLPPQVGGISGELLARYCRMLAFSPRPVTELWISQRAALPLALDQSNAGAVINLRTSAGKTRVAELAILQTLGTSEGARVLYIAPFRALALEVEHSLERMFTGLGFTVSHLYGGSRVSSVDAELAEEASVLIATPEKTRALLRAKPEIFHDVRLVVLDEGHLIGGSERDVRNEVFVDHLRVLARAQHARLLLLSAVLPNPQELAEWVAGDRACVVSSAWKPSGERFGLLRWKKPRVRVEWLGELPFFNRSFVVARPLEFGQGRNPFPNNKNEAIAASAVRLSSVGPVMIFTARKNSVAGLTENVLTALGQNPPDHGWPEHEWKVFEALCVEDLGSDCLELRAVRKGVVCHSGDLTPQVRLAVDLLMRAKPPRVIVATSTLAQGVNVGISSVIIATPYLSSETIGKRDFWNICGRAGRAFVDGEGKVLYAIDMDRRPDQIRRDEALAAEYFETVMMDPVLSGLLYRIVELQKAAAAAGVSFERLLELAAENDFSSLGAHERMCARVCDLVDDQLLALGEDPLVNPEEHSPELWVEEVFRGSLGAIQARAGALGVREDDLLGFLRARAVAVNALVPDRGRRRAVVSSGLSLAAGREVQARLEEFRSIADQYAQGADTADGLAHAVEKLETWTLLHAGSLFERLPDAVALAAVRGGWLEGTALGQLSVRHPEAKRVCAQFYGYGLPWVIHAASQQLRAEGDEVRAESLSKVALLVELGLPDDGAARIFLAGVRSRSAAAEMSKCLVTEGSSVSTVRRLLRMEAIRMVLRERISAASLLWLDLLGGGRTPQELSQPNFGPIELDGGIEPTVLHVRSLGGQIYLCDPLGRTRVPVQASAALPFDRIVNDSRWAFVRSEGGWELQARDPRSDSAT